MSLKRIAVIASACLLGGLLVFCLLINRKDHERDTEYKAWQSARLEAEVQCQELESQIKKLEKSYQEKTDPKATTHIVFTDLSEGVYTKCYPQMKEKKYTGTLAVSSKEFPGLEGCITVEQYKELVEDGWDVCVQWEGSNNINRWWTNLQKEMQELDMNPEGMIYFPKGTYSANLDSRLRQMGFNVVISEKEDKESPLQKDYEEDIWHLGAMGNMTVQPKKWLREAIAQDANVIFLVSFKIEHQRYDAASFPRMLSTFNDYVVTKELLVCNVKEAREHYKVRLNGVSPEIEEEYQATRKELEKELEKTQKELEKIDAQYQ